VVVGHDDRVALGPGTVVADVPGLNQDDLLRERVGPRDDRGLHQQHERGVGEAVGERVAQLCERGALHRRGLGLIGADGQRPDAERDDRGGAVLPRRLGDAVGDLLDGDLVQDDAGQGLIGFGVRGNAQEVLLILGRVAGLNRLHCLPRRWLASRRRQRINP
jgi:hypothetical protein